MTVFTSNISETNLNGNITLNHLTVHQRGVSVTGGTALSGNTIGVNSNIASATKTYNFYAEGSASNFLRGSTHIGGTTARNTFGLWESTLTEEQKEQLAAGTLVAPTNVSLPGDGSFARQWYYDQQVAETQAELDAGTLDYPTHLAAATFTDTFALGDNTAINLLSNGRGEFSGGVKITGGIRSEISSGIYFESNRLRFKTDDKPVFSVGDITASRDFNLITGITSATVYGFDTRGCPEADYVTGLNVNFINSGNPTNHTFKELVGVRVQDAAGANVSDILAAFMTGVQKTDVGTGGGYAFSFLAKSDAPSHFSGETRMYQYSETPYNALGPASRSVPGMIVRPEEACPIDMYNAATNSSPVVHIMRATANAGDKFIEFKTGSSSVVATIKGKIDLDASGVLRFNTSSDYRLKENFGEIDDSIDRVKSLNPLRFNYIDYPGIAVDGFLAHEVQPLVPTAISGEKDAVDEDGNPEYQTIDHSKLIPLLTKALQEALTKIETLETRLADAGIA